ncbi:cytochrome-c peroxidase [Aquimarina sp. 2201CG5-10]|uniref:cytochrome-c peroxidase n=1 Tax=Aquimarina callyspongiae TaxID=3098150 RepID=UPI002AB49D09|nr:cytochrome c peroxidase [Aquimarina sp. 2201CG5-10]MDY8137071.1 cytochrome c peroxidase [Aquimarina sp. 2201CG5-10]
MKKVFFFLSIFVLTACSSNDEYVPIDVENTPSEVLSTYFDIDFENLSNYANQTIPNYITKDNTPADNSITDLGAILGRVLFYDKNLSANNTISCSSCHKQAFAFGDNNIVSTGLNGFTGRHSMRLINARFSTETRFFWDERAISLEDQTTRPIQDHIEMGYSGLEGDPDFNDLIAKLAATEYYPELFTMVFGDNQITEPRIQNVLAQFIRSIQSFDSKYDAGRAQVGNDNQNFPNFTQNENNGKTLFTERPQFNDQGVRVGGGFGCAGCHRAPEFDIDPNSRNNGVIGIYNSNESDLTITRSPSLRDAVNNSGSSNGAFFHDGSAATLEDVLNHYNSINQNNVQLDQRLRPGGNNLQNLNMTDQEMNDIIAFISTLSGQDVYTNEKWSDPFIN